MWKWREKPCWTSQESKKILMTWPDGQNKKCDIVSPLNVKARPRAVPATPPSGHLMTGDQEYVITITTVQLSLLVLCLLPVFSLHFTSTLQPPTHSPMQFKSPGKITLTDPAQCPCPCLDGDFRPGLQWMHLDGLPQWDMFLQTLTSSAVAEHVAAHVVPPWSLICETSAQATLSRCCGHGWGPVYGSDFFHFILPHVNPQLLLVQLYLPPNTVFTH